MFQMPSYVIFGVFPRAMYVIKGESQLSETKAASNLPCHRKKIIWKAGLKAQKLEGKFKRKQQPAKLCYRHTNFLVLGTNSSY